MPFPSWNQNSAYRSLTLLSRPPRDRLRWSSGLPIIASDLRNLPSSAAGFQLPFLANPGNAQNVLSGKHSNLPLPPPHSSQIIPVWRRFDPKLPDKYHRRQSSLHLERIFT